MKILPYFYFKNDSPATSSESFEQSFPAAALSNCKIRDFSCAKVSGTKICKFSTPGLIFTFVYCCAFRTARKSLTEADNVNSAAISRSYKYAFDALSLEEYLISSEAALSSALAQNSLQLSCKPESRKIPVDFNSIPAILLQQK
uniref:Uncharacterized protein n=1 Tax=Pseudonaja textilis TaxID=8673 RepID=A0A670YR20_PSETE